MKTDDTSKAAPVLEGMNPSPIRTATASADPAVVATIVLAFASDPMARWMYSEPGSYLKHFPEFIRAFGGRAFDHGSAHYLDGFRGASLWLPPGVEPDEAAIMALLQRTLPAPQQPAMFSIFEQMAGFHPAESHWYLPLIGVDPARHRRGYGSVLLRHALNRCDRENRLAYLESSNPENVPLYERRGFTRLGRIQAGTSPALYPMLREPRSA